MEYACKKCGTEISDIATAMVTGCECGSRIFKKSNLIEMQEYEQPIVENEAVQEDEHSDISILIEEKGVYSVNIESLVSRESHLEPIFIQDTKGKISVVFNPDA